MIVIGWQGKMSLDLTFVDINLGIGLQARPKQDFDERNFD